MGIFSRSKPEFRKAEMDEMPAAPRPVNHVPQQPQPPVLPMMTPPVVEPGVSQQVSVPMEAPQQMAPPMPIVNEPVAREPIVKEQMAYSQPAQQQQEQQRKPEVVPVPVFLSESEMKKEQFNICMRIENKLDELLSLIQEEE